VLALATLAACAPPHAPAPRASAPPAPAALRVGTSGDYAPFSFSTADRTRAGFDVEVARAYAADRGRALVLVPFHWPELAARLAAGDFDVVMSGVTVRPDRLVTGIMTATVARAEAVLAVAGSAEDADADGRDGGTAAAARGFDRPERTIAVNRGGHLEQVARARFPRARLLPVDDNTSLPALLARGEVDAIVTDTLELAAFEARCAPRPDGETACFRVAARLARDRKAYWLPLSQSALAADLDAWLLERERSGWLPALRARLLGDAQASPLPAPAAALVEHVRRRLSLMPAVAAAKHAAGLPIEDRAREDGVARDAAARATAVGLDTGSFLALVRDEIAVAKAIQRATPPDTATPFTLDELRHAIDRLDSLIVLELAALAPVAAPPEDLAADMGDDVPGLTPASARALARALVGVAPRSDAFSTGRAPSSGSILRHIFAATGVAWGGAGCGNQG
jgi:polar amino acid transport system substrate-binding protein